jgi:hypothetical protein
MFGKTKKVVEVDGLPITLSKRQAFNRFTGAITSHFQAYKNGDEWIGLVSYEQFREEMDEIRERQELILDHLKLKYVPETKKPAKLVEKTDYLIVNAVNVLSWMDEMVRGGGGFDPTPTKPKKKRGRPKKK